MKYREFRPSVKYEGFIKAFWSLEGGAAYSHYSLADVCPELLFHYKGIFDEVFANNRTDKTFSSGVHGQTTAPRRFTIDNPFGIFGVSFYPHALPFLFGMPSNELTDEMPDLRSLLGANAAALEEKIFIAENHRQRIDIIESFVHQKLEKRFEQELPVFYCIRTIIKNNGRFTVRQLASQCFLSERQLERQFKRYAGLSPKMFMRVIRFLSAANHYGNPIKSLTGLALEFGYYDQSHFIHDFIKFSSLHPRHYFSGNTGATDWRD